MTHGLTRWHLLQGAGALTFAGLLTTGFAPLAQASGSATGEQLQALRERWVDQLTGRKLITAGDPDFAAALSGLDTAVNTSVALLVSGPGRSQVFSDAALTVDAQMVTTYKRLAQMATAWATPGSAHENNAALLGQVLLALEGAADPAQRRHRPRRGIWQQGCCGPVLAGWHRRFHLRRPRGVRDVQRQSGPGHAGRVRAHPGC
nr:hypothetical protein [Arthrobacter alpinus]